MTGRSTSPRPAQRAPGLVRGGRGQAGKYTLEQPPEPRLCAVGLCRVRPLSRRGVMALHEAAFARERRTRGGTA